jgi:hypothetical protein
MTNGAIFISREVACHAALARFLQTIAPAARRMRRSVSLARRVSFLRHIVFQLEGGLIINRMRWALADELRRQADFECSVHPDASHILDLLRGDIPVHCAADWR